MYVHLKVESVDTDIVGLALGYGYLANFEFCKVLLNVVQEIEEVGGVEAGSIVCVNSNRETKKDIVNNGGIRRILNNQTELILEISNPESKVRVVLMCDNATRCEDAVKQCVILDRTIVDYSGILETKLMNEIILVF